MGPLSSEELWRPQLLINRFSSFKEPISFQRAEFICKAPRRSLPNSLFRGGGLWLDLTWEQSHPLFADLFLQGLGSPKSSLEPEECQVLLISSSKDNGLLCPSDHLLFCCCSGDSGPSPKLHQEKVKSWHRLSWRD